MFKTYDLPLNEPFYPVTYLVFVLFQFDEILENKAMEVAAKFGTKNVALLEVLIVDQQYRMLGLADRIHVW